MGLRQYLDVLNRGKWLIVMPILVFGLAAAVASSRRPPAYEASARVLLRPGDPLERVRPQEGPGAPNSVTADRVVAAQMEIVRSDEVAREAAKSLPGSTPEAIGAAVSVAQLAQSDVLAISATHPVPARARDIANAVALAYMENRRQVTVASLRRLIDNIGEQLGQLQARIADLDRQIAQTPPPPPGQADIGQDALGAARAAAAREYEVLFARQQDLSVDVDLKRGEAELINAAVAPTSPVSPRPRRDAILAGLFGGLFGLGLAVLREQLDERIRSEQEVARITGLPVIGELPFDAASAKRPQELAAVVRPFGPLAEAVRALRTSLQCLAADRPLKVIVVTSPGPGEGKSLVAANLAAAYAQAGYRTRLVAADLRRPHLPPMLGGATSSPGLTGVVAAPSSDGRRGRRDEPTTAAGTGDGAASAVERRTTAEALVSTAVPNLAVLPSGSVPANPAELLGSRRMAEVLADLAASGDVVVIDTPPVLPVTDAAVLAPKVDAVVLVTAAGETSGKAARRAKAILELTGVRLVGAVLNKAPVSEYATYYGDDGRDGDGARHRSQEPGRDEEAPALVIPVTPDLAPAPVPVASSGPSATTRAPARGSRKKPG